MRNSLVSASAAAIAAAVPLFHVGRLSPTQPATPMPSVEGTKLRSRLPVAFVPDFGRPSDPCLVQAKECR